MKGVEAALVKVKRAEDAILDALYADPAASAEEIDAEINLNDAEFRVMRLRSKVKKVLQDLLPPIAENGTNGSEGQGNDRMSTMHLPKVKIPTYNGEIGDWLGFWSQFENIHEDERLTDSVKFQYLKQAMVYGTKGYRIVNAYPQSAANYPKVVTELKIRCGDKVLLSEFYVRQLIKVLIRVNTGRGNEGPLSLIYDELESHLRCLESLGISVEHSGTFLYPMIESSLPLDTIKVWQRTASSGYGEDANEKTSNERLLQLMKFLKQEVKGEERLNFVKEDPVRESASHGIMKSRHKVRFNDETKGRSPPTVSGLFSGEAQNCIFCGKSNHDSQNCFSAKKMSLEERRAIIQKKRCCYSCLRPNHTAQQCKAFVCCAVCGQKHSTIMHNYSNANPVNNDADKQSSTKQMQTGQPTNLNASFASSSTVYLGTFKTTIVYGKKKATIRGLYDPGAHRSYIGMDLANKMQLLPVGEELIRHTLFGGVQTKPQRFKKFDINIQNANGKGLSKFRVLEKERIYGNLQKLPKGQWIDELRKQGISFSDIDDDTPEEIELLVGADFHGKCFTRKVIQLKNGLTAIETILGWVITGEMDGKYGSDESIAMSVTTLHIADSSIEKLWSLESIGICDNAEVKCKEEREKTTKEHCLKNVSRLKDGRYSVKLPGISGCDVVPDNRSIAEKRLITMTEKLVKKGMFEKYEEVFKQWESEEFIEEVHGDSISQPCCYLPHRAVFKPSSLTTPIRPVFDASCRTKRSPSLNDCLEKGPNLLEQIPALLLRFREKNIGVTSDIRKAFQMVEVHEDDRDFLRFFWWENYDQKKLKTYRHRRVVFGVNCSPFLLAAVIEAHLNCVDDSRRPVAQKLLQSFYVDNCVTSVDTIKDYEDFRDQATQIMSEAKMDLRVWQCSSREETGVGSLISRECGLGNPGVVAPTGDGNVTTVLGMAWNTFHDTMACDLNQSELPEKFTKRNVLSFLQQIFDPLGFVCPVTLLPKKIIQQAWSEKSGWDDELSDDHQASFRKWMEQSNQIKDVLIPRSFREFKNTKELMELHCFCDASQEAYAAVIYLKSQGEKGTSVQLLTAKSRIAPLKKMTIPRLELMACSIGARLIESVKKAISIKDVSVFYWSDSSTALAWIKGNNEWGTFVGNRVKEILTISESEAWRHVPGSMNPADLPSRGCNPSQLLSSKWWEGPAWLRTVEDWPHQTFAINNEEVLIERRKTPVVLLTTSEPLPWYARFSSYFKSVRVMARMRRFIMLLRGKVDVKGPLTIKEIRDAEITILKMIQQESFKVGDSVINGLKVYRDEDNVIYVESKLLYRDDKLGFKKPILLPSSHPIVDRLIEETHKIYGHAGVQFVMGVLREKFWILRGRKTGRRIISSCVTCRRFSAKHPVTQVAPLPEERVKVSVPFETSGVDLAGPLFLKGKEKVWVVLITCAVFRCVHLELVRSLSTEAFLDAFSRFMDRRGRPVTVYSDNGTNFVGAVNLFKGINWDKVSRITSIHRIQWKFNPPSAAWWGGWWERLVRSMKDLLKRILGTARVTYDKSQTYLTSVESCLNGRPLTTVTEDPEDLRPLTPSMFLHDLPTSKYAELDFTSGPELQQQLQQRKTILDEFRVRFRREYLGQLMQRVNQRIRKDIKVGDVVLIGDDNRKRWVWPLAKVVEMFPGQDGVVRVVRVKTATGVLTRPIQRLFPLELSSPTDIPLKLKSSIDSVTQKKSSEQSTQDSMKTPEVMTRSGRKVRTPKKFTD